MADALYMARKQKAFAWAKYYKEVARRLDSDYANYQLMVVIKTEETSKAMPDHLIKSISDMSAALKKTWDCAICQDIIKPGELDITTCGHFFCKGCLEEHKQRSAGDCKCPTCRHKLSTSERRPAE